MTQTRPATELTEWPAFPSFPDRPLSREHYEMLASFIRDAIVSARESTNAEMLWWYASAADSRVRVSVVLNPNVPIALLWALTRDADLGVKACAVERLYEFAESRKERWLRNYLTAAAPPLNRIYGADAAPDLDDADSFVIAGRAWLRAVENPTPQNWQIHELAWALALATHEHVAKEIAG